MKLKTLSFVNEMAKPLQHHLSKTYYHGTSTHKNAKNIIKSGKIIAPKLTSNTALTPIDGFVYMTPEKSYAQIYALGANMAGSDMSTLLKRDDKYGFIFVINNKDLKNIQPDEDSIGELIEQTYNKNKNHWLIKLAKHVLSDEYLSNNMTGNTDYADYEDNDDYGADYTAYTSIYDLIVKHGEYDAYAVGGKILLKYFSDKEKLKIIDMGAHIANKGSVSFSEVWRLDKNKSKQLLRDGSNLEKLVDKDKTGKKFLKSI